MSTTPTKTTQATHCMCKDRPLEACPGEWEPGCDLGANEKYVRRGPGLGELLRRLGGWGVAEVSGKVQKKNQDQ
jgi:hypothetical protein